MPSRLQLVGYWQQKLSPNTSVGVDYDIVTTCVTSYAHTLLWPARSGEAAVDCGEEQQCGRTRAPEGEGVH